MHASPTWRRARCQDPRPGEGETAQGAYYLEQRDPDFEEKMAEVLYVYRQVKLLKKAATASKKKPNKVAIISYDEKPGIQAIQLVAPDLPCRCACYFRTRAGI
jgi:hypothetical protein